jgi:nicotinate phosphoribosyltransferase
VFELFVRKLPPGRNFLIAAGLEQAVEFLEGLRFGETELEWIRSSGLFKLDFADRLAALRFTGDVHAMPEGTVFFPNEPIVRVTAPMPEAQLVESRLVNLVHFEVLVASKAARCVLAAPGRRLIDFGLRRAHGAEAGLLAARASYLAGFDGTSAALAAPRFGIPVLGTMAHSFVQAHATESAAFAHFVHAFPQTALLLIDTYDTVAAARKVAELAPQLARDGIALRGVRLDSGDLAQLAREVRRVLDEAGLATATIFASGNLDERRVRDLVTSGAPIDAFGIGTSLVTSADAPYLDAVYKLQEYAGRPRRKRSTGKATWPGRKQVFRRYGPDGHFARDVVAEERDRQPGTPLIEQVMAGGRRLRPLPALGEIRARARAQLDQLPPALRTLEDAPEPYPVDIAAGLRVLAAEVDAATEGGAAAWRTGPPLAAERLDFGQNVAGGAAYAVAEVPELRADHESQEASMKFSGWKVAAPAAALALAMGVALAQQPAKPGPGPGPGMGSGMMGGYGPGGPGYGMGPGMMGGYGPGGPGGYGPGYGMGPGMMGGGMMGGGMMGMGPGMGRALWSLDLSDAQRKEVIKVQDELRKKNWEIAGKMQDEMARLRDAYWGSDKRDRQAISAAYKKLGELRQQRVENSLDAAERIEKVLTAEQRGQLRRLGPWWSDEVQ